MEFQTVTVERPEDTNVVIGQSHFIKTVEDVYEAMVNSVPGVKFGVAFCESSGPCLIRHTGTDRELEEMAVANALRIAAGHTFIVIMRIAWPVNVLGALRAVPEICGIFCATANPVSVIVADDGQGRGIMGVIDGLKPRGVEGEADQRERHAFLRKIGYKQ
ncbi:MAG: hypothetical protein FJY88_05370 [Candidatus Eisenbacteria bacterium]|nr:hypothetical protein [Candidatus Eisenbacteria bacterium]